MRSARRHSTRASAATLWLVGTALAAACGLSAKSIHIEAVDGKEVIAQVGSVISLSLSDNPSTGYQWTATVEDLTVVVPDDDSRGASQRATNGEGAQGRITFRFRAMAPGHTAIVLALARPWEDQPIETRRLRVAVEPGR